MFFYTKSGHPFGDHINRLVVGIGAVEGVGPILFYDSANGSSYPMGDRVVRHSVRPDGAPGFLLPYHDYLEPTGDDREDEQRRDLLAEIVVVPEPAHVATFSYAGEHAGADVALSTLVRTLEAVRRIKRHGVAAGPWDQREDWLNDRIARVWQQRGAFPGAGGMPKPSGAASARPWSWSSSLPAGSGCSKTPGHSSTPSSAATRTRRRTTPPTSPPSPTPTPR